VAITVSTRSRRISPLGTVAVLALAVTLAAGLIIPGLTEGRSLRPSPAQVCQRNLRQIALACAYYADDHDGTYPDRLQRLYRAYVDDGRCFSCPAYPAEHRDFDTGTVRPASSSYVLVAGLTTAAPPGTILLHDKLAENHRGAGRNVAFADAHVEWMREPVFRKRLGEQRKQRTGPAGAGVERRG
jgi:prepilin-type processing-associated H-X9-DG protein